MAMSAYKVQQRPTSLIIFFLFLFISELTQLVLISFTNYNDAVMKNRFIMGSKHVLKLLIEQ